MMDSRWDYWALTVQQYYYELVAQFLESKDIGLYNEREKLPESKSVSYNTDHFYLNKLDRAIDQLKRIKDDICTLRAGLNQRSVLFKHGGLKKKLDAILTREDVVKQLRALKTLRTAYATTISTGLNKWLSDYLETLDKTEIFNKVNPKTDFAWTPALCNIDGVDATGLTVISSGYRAA